jgi:cytochrome c
MRILVAVAFAATLGCAARVVFADEFSDPGRRIFQQRCQTCHGVTAEADTALGPSLKGVLGRKAGGGDSGVHSRAAIESDTVWTRSSMRRYLSEPGREMPGTLMQARVTDGRELDDLLNYLETLR